MLALAPIALATPAHAQPTWSFRVEVLPAKLYMGEWNKLYVNITNMDCNMRTYHVLELKSASEKYVEAIAARAWEMRDRGLIGSYSLAVGNMWGSGGEATEQADPAILNPLFFPFFSHFRRPPQENKGRRILGWYCGGEGYG